MPDQTLLALAALVDRAGHALGRLAAQHKHEAALVQNTLNLLREVMGTSLAQHITDGLDKLVGDLSNISDQLKNAANNTDPAAVQAALQPIADRLDAIVQQADQLSTSAQQPAAVGSSSRSSSSGQSSGSQSSGSSSSSKGGGANPANKPGGI